MIDEIWNKRREKLEAESRAAILALFGHTGAQAFKMPLNPPHGREYISVKVETI